MNQSDYVRRSAIRAECLTCQQVWADESIAHSRACKHAKDSVHNVRIVYTDGGPTIIRYNITETDQ